MDKGTGYFRPPAILLMIVLMLLSSISLYAFENNMPPVRLDKSRPSYLLGPYTAYIEDAQSEMSVKQAYDLFSQESSKVRFYYDNVFNLGLSDSTYWLKLDFRDGFVTDKQEKKWFLEISYPLVKSIDLYFYSQGIMVDHQHSGDNEKYKDMSSYRAFVFPFKNERINKNNPEQFELLIKVEPRILMLLPMTLWDSAAFSKHTRVGEYWLGIYFGLMIMMALYGLVVSFSVKDRSYFYFVSYILSTILFFFTFSGMMNQYLGENSGYWNDRFPLAFCFLAMAFVLKFSSSFVSLNRYSSRLARFIDVCFVSLCAFSFLVFYNPTDNLIVAALVLAFLFFVFIIYIAIYSYFRGSRAGKILFVSFSILFISTLIFTCALFAIIPVNWLNEVSFYIGSVTSALFLSLGLVDQVNEQRRQRFQALIRENHAVQNLRKLEEKAATTAMIDPLTSLPNRAALERFSKDFFESKERKFEPLVVAFVQLQGYDQINHSLGFRSGDLLIEKIASRLNRVAAEIEDCLAIRIPGQANAFSVRIDSAAFVTLFRMRDTKKKYINDIQHIIEVLNRPVSVNDMKLEAKARVGISFLPEHSTNIFTLARFAQAAIESSNNPAQNLILYSSVIGQEAARKLKLVSDLRIALNRKDFSLVFQPQLDIRKGKIVALEALIRWKHPELGDLSPDEFIILAEQAGLIDGITQWVLATALDSLAWLIERGIKLKLSINVSAKNLAQENFHDMIISELEKRALSPSLLTIELTETSLMNEQERGIKVLREIHKSGIKIAIDDFGSGYSSLAYFKELSISELKVDKSFINQIDSLHSDRVITKSTIALAHEMGAIVCAEGVETAASLKVLVQYECDLAQGFYIARPMKKEEIPIWMDEHENAFSKS